MSEEDDGNRLRALVKAVSDDLWIAIATFEVYAPTAFDASLIEKVNEREVYPAFNVISEALEATTISALCRIWDKTGDAARIAEIEKLLRRRPDLAGDSGALRRWLGGVEMVEKSEELQALRAIRNMRLAHTHDPNRPDSRLRSGVRKAVNEDEPLLLEATILVVQQLHGLIGSPDPLDYRAEREAWRCSRRSILEGHWRRETLKSPGPTATACGHIMSAGHAVALRALRVPLPRAGIVAEGDCDGWVDLRDPIRGGSAAALPQALEDVVGLGRADRVSALRV